MATAPGIFQADTSEPYLAAAPFPSPFCATLLYAHRMLSEKPWKLHGLMYLVFCLLLCVAFMIMVIGIVQHFTGAKPDDNSPVFLVLSSLALDGSILVSIFLFLRLEDITWAEAFGFKNCPLWRPVLWGIIVAVLFTFVGQEMNGLCGKAIERFSHKAAPNEEAVETLQKATPGFCRAYLIFFAIIIAPVAEECLFRGILYPSIKRYGYPRAALWGTAVLFAAIHLNLAAFLPLMLFAVILSILYEKTNNLLSCIVAHSMFNAANVLVLFFYGASPS
jgi:membrane protease YdiL (CAAX protease family)